MSIEILVLGLTMEAETKFTRLYSHNFTDLYIPSGTLDSPVSDSEDKVESKEKSVGL